MEPTTKIAALENEVSELKERIARLEQTYEVAPRLPQTGLVAEGFLRRSFTVWGHNVVASLIIASPFYIIGGLMILFGVFSALH